MVISSVHVGFMLRLKLHKNGKKVPSVYVMATHDDDDPFFLILNFLGFTRLQKGGIGVGNGHISFSIIFGQCSMKLFTQEKKEDKTPFFIIMYS